MHNEKKIIYGVIVVAVLTVLLFVIGFDFGEKPKQDIEGQTMTIDSSKYSRYIFVGTDSIEYINEKIDEYLDMMDINGAASEHFMIEQHGNVYIIVVLESIDFDTYHNLIGWLGGMSYESDIPAYSVGIAYHNSNDKLGYMCALQQINPGDTLVGQMRDGRIMTIYLPEAYNEIVTFHNDDYDISALESYIELMQEDGVLD